MFRVNFYWKGDLLLIGLFLISLQYFFINKIFFLQEIYQDDIWPYLIFSEKNQKILNVKYFVVNELLF